MSLDLLGMTVLGMSCGADGDVYSWLLFLVCHLMVILLAATILRLRRGDTSSRPE